MIASLSQKFSGLEWQSYWYIEKEELLWYNPSFIAQLVLSRSPSRRRRNFFSSVLSFLPNRNYQELSSRTKIYLFVGCGSIVLVISNLTSDCNKKIQELFLPHLNKNRNKIKCSFWAFYLHRKKRRINPCLNKMRVYGKVLWPMSHFLRACQMCAQRSLAFLEVGVITLDTRVIISLMFFFLNFPRKREK